MVFSTVTRQSGTISAFVDGQQVVSPISTTIKTPTAFRIGSQWGIRHFNGKIDDIRIYNRALTSSEISALYNEGLVGTLAITLFDAENWGQPGERSRGALQQQRCPGGEGLTIFEFAGDLCECPRRFRILLQSICQSHLTVGRTILGREDRNYDLR